MTYNNSYRQTLIFLLQILISVMRVRRLTRNGGRAPYWIVSRRRRLMPLYVASGKAHSLGSLNVCLLSLMRSHTTCLHTNKLNPCIINKDRYYATKYYDASTSCYETTKTFVDVYEDFIIVKCYYFVWNNVFILLSHLLWYLWNRYATSVTRHAHFRV